MPGIPGRPSRLPGDDLPETIALTPAAKRALLDSLQISRAVGASYLGPEHVLMALGLNKGDHIAIWAANLPEWKLP